MSVFKIVILIKNFAKEWFTGQNADNFLSSLDIKDQSNVTLGVGTIQKEVWWSLPLEDPS